MRKQLSVIVAGILAGSFTAVAQAESARDYISVVGSSTVYPFSTVVAEQFGKSSKFKTPKIESTGTGGGFKLFCNGVGVEHPDISNASRRIKSGELETCRKNGVNEVVEVKIGYDGIAVANSKKARKLELSRKDLFLALAKEVPNPADKSKLVPNPYKTWKDVNEALPEIRIEVLGPPPTSGTRDAFVELAMEESCDRFEAIKALKETNKEAHKKACKSVREDGAYVEAGENDNLIVQKLEANANAVGIFGYSFLEQNSDKVQGSAIEGVDPTFESIAKGDYQLSRPLYIYAKKAHAGTIPGIKEFLTEFTSEKAWGDEGYLADKGLIPMPKDERAKFAADARELKPLGSL